MSQQFMSGNRDGVGTGPSVFQKILSEAKKSYQLDENVVISLMKLREYIIKDCESLYRLLPNSTIHGYVQCVQAYPFSVTCYSEAGIQLYHILTAGKPLYCDATGTIVSISTGKPLYCDATGTIVSISTRTTSSNSSFEDKQLLYYALVVSNPLERKKPSTAVAEFVSSDHSIPAFMNFLQVFRRSEAQLYGYGNKVTPSHIVIDRSRVLLLSFLSVYNEESLHSYLHQCFRIVTGSGTVEDCKCTFVLACISHVMNSFKGDLKHTM